MKTLISFRIYTPRYQYFSIPLFGKWTLLICGPGSSVDQIADDFCQLFSAIFLNKVSGLL